MEAQLCQMCNERKAFKKVVSDHDGSFFLVCKKKKCSDRLYDQLMENGTETQRENIRQITWDSDLYQGRGYRKVLESEKLGWYSLLGFIVAIAIMLIVKIIVNL